MMALFIVNRIISMSKYLIVSKNTVLRNVLKIASHMIYSFCKISLQNLLQLFGLEINRINISSLNKLEIGYVIDVGAYQGQFASQIRREGYKGQIYSFEPLLNAHKQLLRAAAKDDNWKVHKPVALGSQPGIAVLNISANPTSSSITEMLSTHLFAAPYSYKTGEQEVSVITLDSMIEKWRLINSAICLKIDTQGYEYEILLGGQETLNLVSVVQIELSIIELYRGQKLYKHFIEFFENKNFILYDIIPGFSNKKTGQLLQFDAIFVKKTT
jgi:FkbM family methyltransferase